MLQQTSIAKQLAAEVAEERSRLDRIGHSEVSLPADHVVWSVLASPGSTVPEGQTILDLADCTRRFVVVDLPEREFEQIKPNAPTEVRLIGGDEWRQGNVLRVIGSAARTDDRLLAAQVPHPTSSSIAKAGNINHALTKTSADFVAIFDADFIPQRNFLMRTIGFLPIPASASFRSRTLSIITIRLNPAWRCKRRCRTTNAFSSTRSCRAATAGMQPSAAAQTR
jgi:hypothetical protein